MTGVDRIELALIRKIGDFRNDPARRRAFDRACNEAKAKFMMEQDGSPEMTDWIATRIANLEREHGPQLDIDARHRNYRGKSSTLDSDDDRAYRERIAMQQDAAAKAARKTKPLPWIDGGGKYGDLPGGIKIGDTNVAEFKNVPQVKRRYPTSSRSYHETHPEKPAPVPHASYETPMNVGKYERASLERSDLNGAAEHMITAAQSTAAQNQTSLTRRDITVSSVSDGHHREAGIGDGLCGDTAFPSSSLYGSG